ncbi:methylated-DNA--[protein]-cysteine S-methyltransferase [Dethiobacter alkaliphilus]|uniref:methylated-DNA--[protein]-cysteine S-methyltransferase n=1 Tax=Dethiobacter alkaliphilus AHT 1 TaxID=555088 RepID=C0GFZ1_DETAL|nr:methylated-DNA--[protein]-cysteine S-methyltransferase [Dethiobacter alkaliphilus]EEG77680.1 methylated-DNA/protein-cysteine methyltransferase [Dethiobacter alkaliphilus AHT 1]
MEKRFVETVAGVVCLVYGDGGLLQLGLPGQESGDCPAVAAADPQWVRQLAADLKDYFAGKRVSFRCPVDYGGYPPFFRRVLEACRTISYGESRSYGWLAREAGSPKAVRAAGQAMANNRTVLVIPCHRVVKSDGGLGGFSSGLSWKERLLQLEQA